jgi:PAB1-binding protein PBP1
MAGHKLSKKCKSMARSVKKDKQANVHKKAQQKLRNKRRTKSRTAERKRKNSRAFGSDTYGPGYVPNPVLDMPNSKGTMYYGNVENFVLPPNWWMPVTNGAYQMPDMLFNYK